MTVILFLATKARQLNLISYPVPISVGFQRKTWLIYQPVRDEFRQRQFLTFLVNLGLLTSC